MAVFGRTSARQRGGRGYSIDVDDEEMQAVLSRMSSPTTARRIVQRSLNAGIKKANTHAKRTLAKRRNLKVSEAGKQLRVIRATNTVLEASIRASGSPINLYKTKGTKTQTKAGVKANPGTGRRLFPGAFIAKMPSGHIGVFERIHPSGAPGAKRVERTRPGGGVYLSQLPIREIRLPSLASTLVQAETVEALDSVAMPTYLNELQRLMQRALSPKG